MRLYLIKAGLGHKEITLNTYFSDRTAQRRYRLITTHESTPDWDSITPYEFFFDRVWVEEVDTDDSPVAEAAA